MEEIREMGTTAMDRSFRHIVDVDGLLIGIEQTAIDVDQLLSRAGLPQGQGHGLVRLSGEQAITLPGDHLIQLREDDVPFFRSVRVTAWAAGSIAA
ncbi:hypothetical protein EAH79_11720 [Sphingomonas koreensis]|nr:hypothetical protein EAH79_11720 [Sphingomonas koreensis]